MIKFTEVYDALKEISNHERIIADARLSVHFTKLCVLISATEFEKCIKEKIKDFLKFSKHNMQQTIKILLVSKKNNTDFVYSLFHCNDENKGFSPSMEMFFVIFGNNFRKKVEKCFSKYVEKQIKLYEKKLHSVSADSEEYIKLSDEISAMRLVLYKEAQEDFLELKFLRNKLAHHYMDATAFVSYTVNDIFDKFSRARLFVGALGMAFDFYTDKSVTR